jgi:hypothetical protein
MLMTMQVFAEVVGGLSAITAIVYMIPVVVRRAPPLLFAWDVIVFLLWVVLFGIFGKVWHLSLTSFPSISEVYDAWLI